MENNANKIIVAVAAGMVVVVLALVLGSGINAGGGGGGSSTPSTSTTQDATQTQQDATTDAQTTADNNNASTGTNMTISELEDLINQSSRATGQNARSAATSASVPTVSSVYQEVTQRGFDSAEVEADFDINGNYSDPHVLDSGSSEKYPSYTMFYQSSQDVLWVLYVNDGAYLAVPVSTANGMLSKQIIIVESDVVVQYDGVKNEFSDWPISSITDAVVVRVNSVDKATLDSYSATQLEAM